MIRRVVSGGQTGADRAALDVAMAVGLETGGWVPKGRKAEDGVIPERYAGLREALSANPAVRTRLNVLDADATLIVSHGPLTGGSKLTLREAQRGGKPVLHVDLDALSPAEAVATVREWLGTADPATLNVAGPRASHDAGIAAGVTALLSEVLGTVVPSTPGTALEQIIATPAPYDFDESLRFTRFGPGDPTARRGDGWLEKAWRSPDGPVALRLDRVANGHARAVAWGPGASWAMTCVPALLGLDDRPGTFAPGPPLDRFVTRIARVRLPRVPWPVDKLLAHVFQQRVPFDSASASWRMLLRRHGEAAPGSSGLVLLPPAKTLLTLDDHEWQTIGLDRQRRSAAREVARYAHRVLEMLDLPLAEVRRRLGALRGVGPWTVEMTLGFAFGDPDAVPTGDLHLPVLMGRALAGEWDGNDDRMARLLAPYAGHRFRVIRWAFSEHLRSRPRHRTAPVQRRLHIPDQ